MKVRAGLIILFLLINFSQSHEDASEDEGAGDGSEQTKSLYSASEPIYQVDFSNFTRLIYKQPRAFFIEFYSSWCGGCIAYAPTYKKFARQVKDWKNVVQVTAVNCAAEINRDLCQEHNIDSFPTLKYFKAESSTAKDGKLFEGEHFDVDKLAANLAWIVANEAKATVPKNWPSFEVLNDLSDSVLDKYYKTDTKYIAIILESGKNVVGNQIVLDFSTHSNLRVLLAPKEHALGRSFVTSDFKPPGLLVFAKGNSDPLFVSSKSMSHAEMYEKIAELTVSSKNMGISSRLTNESDNGSRSAQVTNQLQPPDSSRRSVQYQLHLSDLMGALSYMIRHEIGLKQFFGEKQLTALKEFFKLLTQYFPGRPPVRRFLYRLNEWLQIQKAPLDGKKWNSKVAELQAELGRPLPTANRWVACKGSESKWRGYPCGLWNTFHAITVAAYVKEHNDPQFSALRVLESVHGYVRNFFGCHDCADNFEKSAVKLPAEVKVPEDAVLWLWRSHNRANKFLKGTASEDKLFPKQQFPPVELCRECYKDPSRAQITDPESENWDKRQVLPFLIRFYTDLKIENNKETYSVSKFEKDGLKTVSKQDLDLNPKFRKIGESVKEMELVQKKLDAQRMKENLKKMYNWTEANPPTHYRSFLNWTGIDTSLCLVLWVCSSGIVIAVFVYMKWRKSSYRYLKSFSSDYGKYRV